MMKLSTLILVFCSSLISYHAIAQSNTIDLKVPDQIEIEKTGNHVYFENTRVSMVISDKYRKGEGDGRVRVYEFPKKSFSKEKAIFKESIKKSKLKGAIIYYEKEFKLGDYDAYLMYCPKFEGQSNSIILLFGNNNCFVEVEGNLLKDNEKIRQEILSGLLTTTFDQTPNPDYLAFAKFNLDLSKSDFKFFSKLAPQDFYFTENGIGSFGQTILNVIKVEALPPMADFETRKKYAQSMITKHIIEGTKIEKKEEKKIIINNVEAYEITFTGSYLNWPIQVYQIVLGDNKATIHYYSITFQDNLFKQAKEIGGTLRIK